MLYAVCSELTRATECAMLYLDVALQARPNQPIVAQKRHTKRNRRDMTTKKSTKKSSALLDVTTGEVKAIWTHLLEPDTHFDEVGWFKITFRMNEKEGDKLNKQLTELLDGYKKSLEEEGKKVRSVNPCEGKKFTEDDGTTCYDFTAKLRPHFKSKKDGSKIEQRPKVLDAQLKPMGELIGKGSDVKVNFKVVPYNTPMATGLTLRLGAVQVINLVSVGSGGQEDHGFAVVEEGFSSEKEPTSGGATTPNVAGEKATSTVQSDAADF